MEHAKLVFYLSLSREPTRQVDLHVTGVRCFLLIQNCSETIISLKEGTVLFNEGLGRQLTMNSRSDENVNMNKLKNMKAVDTDLS